MTRCKYCRVETGRVAYLVDWKSAEVRCFYAYECRDRMLDRERRIVRVWWLVRFIDARGAEMVDAFWHAAFAHKRARKLRKEGRSAQVGRVTVRRKAKS